MMTLLISRILEGSDPEDSVPEMVQEVVLDPVQDDLRVVMAMDPVQGVFRAAPDMVPMADSVQAVNHQVGSEAIPATPLLAGSEVETVRRTSTEWAAAIPMVLPAASGTSISQPQLQGCPTPPPRSRP